MGINVAKVGSEDDRGGLLLLLGGCAGTESSHTGSVLLASMDSCEQVSLPDYQVDSSGPAVTVPLCPWTPANTGGFHSGPRPCRRSASDECPSVPAPRAAAGASQSPLQGLCERRKVTFTLHQKSKTHTHTHTFLLLPL